MKKIVLLIVVFLTFASSYAQDWEFLFKLEDGEYYYKPHTDETAWIKFVEYSPNKTASQKKIIKGHVIFLWKFDCIAKKIGVIKTTTYSKEGKVLEAMSQDEMFVEMDYVNPDSVGESLLTIFCLP